MTDTTEKFNRSSFFRSINTVGPTDHHQTARLDFWGTVALVAIVGMFAKLIQTLIMN